MGIHGLTTFIQRYHGKHKEKVYLHDCPVVIDGCNLMFFLYFDWRQSTPASKSTPKKGSSSSSGSPLSKPSPLKVPHLFGGDYQFYAQNVRDFFQHLKLCCITPIVLFDGAYDALKIKTAFKRFQENLKLNVRQAGNNLHGITPGFSYSPVFMKAVFIEVLQEQKILHYQTEHEADCTIALIARKLGNCPILSSDSDFHIYVDAVVLPLHTLGFKKVAPSKDKGKKTDSPGAGPADKLWTLHSQFVSLSRLCQKEFNLKDSRMLPLAAVILGNDWIKTSTFSHFHSTTSGGSRVSRNSRIAYLLKWLGKQKSYQRVVHAMLATVRESQRERTAELVNEIVAIYEGRGGEGRVWTMLLETGKVDKFVLIDSEESENPREPEEAIDNLMDGLCLNEINNISLVALADDELLDVINEDVAEEGGEDYSSDCSDTDEMSKTNFENHCVNNTKLPAWYLDAHVKCSFPTYLLKLVNNQMVFLSPQAEVSCLPSTHTMSIPIIRVIAGLLLGEGPNKNLTLVSRHKSRITDIKVDSITKLERFGSLPVLSEACEEFKKCLSQEVRAQIILESLGLYSTDFVEFVNQWPISLRIWVTSLVYFLSCVKHDVNLTSEDDANMTAVNESALPVAISILLSVMKNSVLNPSGSSKKSTDVDRPGLVVGVDCTPSISNLLNQTDQSMISHLRIFYAKFESVADLSSRTFMKHYDITRTYNICRFTCILFHLHQLNRILGDPFKAPRLNSSLNNWFAYNLSGRLSADIKAMEGMGSNNSYLKMGKVVGDLCGANDIAIVIDRVLKLVP